jgi:hypothetical protein
MRTSILGLVGAAALTAGSAAYAADTIDFTNPAGDVGSPTHVYAATGDPTLFVTATGFSSEGVLSPNLYGKNLGGDEVGLGLTADPSTQNEIFRAAFIQLNVTDLFGKVTSAVFNFGSTTLGEQWEVYGSDTAGILGDALLYGQNDESTHDLFDAAFNWGNYDYYSFRSLGTGGPGQGLDGSTTGNVLLGNLLLTPTAVPEPATWGLMLLGFAGIGVALRRRKRAELTFRQVA